MSPGISDPLSGTSPDGGERARARLRLFGALLFGAGAVTLASVLTAPDPDPSDHPRCCCARARSPSWRRCWRCGGARPTPCCT